ncbi:DUF6912 family protein [Streptomyces oceani]|uniref:Uncharacterized protein n=1 Tax=Streptomyces oceani TaxID=1075402 RepID=A0A1E7KGM5_9ACTN|nr:hypothetical protein [Streptomyces oceani]OEV03033.1 hypothetical protein AN216_13390 [Streptomyces oceani]
MRVYVPLTMPALARTHQAGALDPVHTEAYAVTPELRAWCRTEDTEELEYAALESAAHASLRRLAAESGAGRRRVVLAMELPDERVTSLTGAPDAAVTPETAPDTPDTAETRPGAVRIVGPVPADRIAAVHVDEAHAERDVAAATAALRTEGDPEARHALDRVETHELLWYATQEVPWLLE